jgi:site-specific recombinase XerD
MLTFDFLWKNKEPKMLWEEYVKHLRAKGCVPSTIEDYSSDWKRFSIWCWEHGLRRYDQAQASHVREFLISLQGQMSPATIQGYYSTLKALFRWTVNEGYLSSDPMRGIPKPKAPIEPIETYTADEYHQMVAHTETEKERALLLFLYDSGARAMEAARLKWKDLDLAKRRAIIIHGKGQKTRTVPFGEMTEISFRLLAYDGCNPEDYVFLSRYDKPYTRSGIRFLVKRACLKAGVSLRHEVVHSIRHTTACNMLKESRGDIGYVKEILGHSSINTTMRYVRHREAERVLETALTFDSPSDRL